MSLHKSKGLTSRAVIVSSCVEGLIPNIDPKKTPAEQEASFEESRRLFYVAITRSTEFLLLSSITRMTTAEAFGLRARSMPGYGTVRVYPCRFLAEIGPEAPDPVAGPAFMAERTG
jgi:superfamily I DNA/RNA helicase